MSVSWLFPFQTKSIIITHTEKESRFFIIRTKGCFVERTPFKSVVSGLMNKYDKSVERLRNTNRVHLADMFYAKTLFLSYFLCVKTVLKDCCSANSEKIHYCRLTKCEMNVFPFTALMTSLWLPIIMRIWQRNAKSYFSHLRNEKKPNISFLQQCQNCNCCNCANKSVIGVLYFYF